jgi:hypothetical protein
MPANGNLAPPKPMTASHSLGISIRSRTEGVPMQANGSAQSTARTKVQGLRPRTRTRTSCAASCAASCATSCATVRPSPRVDAGFKFLKPWSSAAVLSCEQNKTNRQDQGPRPKAQDQGPPRATAHQTRRYTQAQEPGEGTRIAGMCCTQLPRSCRYSALPYM